MTGIERYKALCEMALTINPELPVEAELKYANELMALTGRVRGEATPKRLPARPRKAAGAGERHGEAA